MTLYVHTGHKNRPIPRRAGASDASVRHWCVSAARCGACRALTRNGHGSALGPLAHVLDILQQQHDQAGAALYDDLVDPQSAQEHLADALTDTGAV